MKKIIFAQVFLFALVSCNELKNEYANNQPEVTAHISFVLGDVKVNGKKAKVKQKITFGDLITTGKKSRANLIVDNGNIIGIQQKSRFQLYLKSGEAHLNLRQGALAAVIKNKKNIKAFKLRTPTSVAGVRGTTVFLKVEPKKKRSYVCLCEGKLHLTSTDNAKSKNVSANHHSGHYVSSKQMKKAPMLHHTDADQEKLASEINQKIDWGE